MLSTSETQHESANQRSNYVVGKRETTRVRQSAVLLCCRQARHNTCPPISGLTMLSTSETQHVSANQRSNYAVN
ncbi:hypothetical protein DPMN_048432 [Dreissena polymorpha]|uniref:Uncharacterized protein n=1 Tax=Dreissena polymorpha TaxID=45954 RepID=A0A9D4DAP2_DREPO|nr:hypothetical protein DPMN_048432 [Dreissena polymorpha]